MTFLLSNGAEFDNAGTLDFGFGAISNSGTMAGIINNAGTFIHAASSAQTVGAGINFTNSGTVEVQSGTLNFGATVSNVSTSAGVTTLTGGTWEAMAGGNLDLGVGLNANAANLVLDGVGSIITKTATASALSGLSHNAAGGSISLLNGQILSMTPGGGTLTNDGTLSLEAGTRLSITGGFAQAADGTLITQLDSGSFGQLAASGAVGLDGTLTANLASGYDPSAADDTVVTGAPVSDLFAHFSGGTTPGGQPIQLTYASNAAHVVIGTLAASLPDLTDASDSGISNSDNLTNVATPTFTGTASGGVSVNIYSDGVLVGSGPLTAGTWVATVSAALPDGTHAITATVVSSGATEGQPSDPLAITIDTTAPGIPGAPALQSASDTGASNTDGITRDNTPTFNVATSPDYFRFFNGATQLSANYASASTFTTVTLADGNYAFTLEAVDAAGNASAPSAAANVTIDTVKPATPSTPTLDPASDSGATGDYVTNVKTPLFTGAAEPNSTVTINWGGAVGTGIAAADGSYSIRAASLTDNTHQLYATAVDLAGNTSANSPAVTLIIDTKAPAQPPAPVLDHTTGSIATLTGTAEAKSTVTLFSDGSAVGAGMADAAGDYSIATIALADGSHAMTVTAADLAGNVSVTSNATSITIDTAVPGIPSAPVLDAASDSGISNSDDITNVTLPTFTGTADPGTTVTILADGALIGSGPADPATGAYRITITTALADGTRSITAIATNANGPSLASGALSITIDTTAPTIQATISSPDSQTGWYNIASGAARVHYVTSDNGGSDSVPIPADHVFSDGSNQSLAGVTIVDTAGNSATSQGFSGISQDTVRPTFTAAIDRSPASTGWYNLAAGAPVVHFAGADGGSGLAAGAIPADVTLGEGASVGVSRTLTDIAGNSMTAGVSGKKIDLTPPIVQAQRDTPANANGWNNTDVDARYSFSDALSGRDTAKSDPSSFVFSNEGAGQSHVFTAFDIAGNSATGSVTGVNIDKTAPTITAAINSAGSTGWYNIATGSARVQYTAFDNAGGSGLATAWPADYVFADGANQSSPAVTVIDLAGNSFTLQAFSGINQDTIAPAVSVQRVTAANANGWNNTDVTVSYSATDATSGVNAAASDLPTFTLTGEGVDQSHTFTVVDNAGNPATGTIGGINIDKTPPTLSVSVAPASPASTGWYNISTGAPVGSFTAADVLSGIDASASGDLSPATLGEGSNVGISRTIYDLAGNSATAGVSGLKVDLTAPAAPGTPVLASQSDNVPTFTGTAEAGSTVNLYADGSAGPIATVAADSSGNYSVISVALGYGGHTITATATDAAGNVSDPSTAADIQINQANVMGVSASWGTSGKAALFNTGVRLLPAGRATDLPWMGINQIQITLDHAATLSSADVSVAGITIANYGPVTLGGSGMAYTITLAQPVNAADRLTITVGNANVSTFTREIDVLPGDVDDDGVVNISDVILVRNAYLGFNGATPNILDDINGDGNVDLTDYNLVRRFIGKRLPAGLIVS